MGILLLSEGYGAERLIMNPHPLLVGTYRLSTHLRDLGYTVRNLAVWRCNLEEFKKIIVKNITPEIKVIGISTTLIYDIPLTDASYEDFFEKVKFIRSIAEDRKIVMGGSLVRSASFNSPNFKKLYSLVDYFIKGQGEQAFTAVLENIFKGQKLTTTNIDPVVCTDDVYPFLDFNDSKIHYTKDDFLNKYDSVGIEYSRGCIFKCSFCNYPGIGKRPGEFIKTKEVLKEELLRNYEEHGLQFYYFTDDLLNESIEKIKDLAEIASSLPFEFRFAAYVRLDLIHRFPEMAGLLRDAGMISGIAGIETINDKSGKSVTKGLGKTRIDETLEICRDAWKNKVGLMGSFILGLPHDTTDTVEELLEWFETPLVKDTINDINITALKISSDEMSKNPKYKYQLKDNILTGWTNQYGYTYEQAEQDSKKTLEVYYKKYQVPVRFSGFDMPQLLAYAQRHGVKESVLDFYFNRKSSSFITNPTDWYRLRHKWYAERRAEYLNSVNK